MDNFSISIEYASVNFRNEDAEVNFKNRWDGSLPHYGLFFRTMNFLSSLGFTVTKDPIIEKDYKCLSKDHRYGRKDDLEFKAERYPVGFKIEFYQNVVHENPHGGEYDFDQYKKMPYLIKKQFLLTCSKLRRFFLNLGYADHSEIEAKTAVDIIKKDFVESCHHAPKDMNFNLSDYDGLTSTMKQNSYPYTFYDRDKKLLHNGEIKYFRDYNGYLCRGKIYHQLNMMFWIIVNDKETTVRADYELFDLTPDEPRCRVAEKRVPKEYINKVKFLADLTEEDLLRELKRRGSSHSARIDKEGDTNA